MPGMTLFEFNCLVNYISERHSWQSGAPGNKKYIKYVRCSFDTRSNMIFSVELDKQLFAVVNENRKRDLQKWIYAWLDNKDDGFKLEKDDPELAELVKPKKKKETAVSPSGKAPVCKTEIDGSIPPAASNI